MKNKRIIATMVAFVLLCGCGEVSVDTAVSNNENGNIEVLSENAKLKANISAKKSSKDNDTEIKKSESDKIKDDSEDKLGEPSLEMPMNEATSNFENEPVESGSCSYISPSFEIIDGSSERTVLEAVNAAQRDATGNNALFNIDGLKTFYSLDNFKIDGYELKEVSISDCTVYYYYFPRGADSSTLGAPYQAFFDIKIRRPEHKDFVNLKGIVEDRKNGIAFTESIIQEWLKSGEVSTAALFQERLKSEEEIINSKTLLEDSILYDKDYRIATADLGETVVSITAPEMSELNYDEMYMLLRDLVFSLTKTAELIKVG